MAVIPLTSSSLDLTISIPGSSGESDDGRSMRNLDINQVPVDGDDDRKWMMTLSLNNIHNSSADMEEDHDDVEGGGGPSPPRKKLRLSKEQSRSLEESFRRNQTLNPKQKEELAMQLKLKARQVEVWFQNRRARSKLKQTEMECEYLKRWFGSLTERNRRLQKEVEQLRAMKAVPLTVPSSTGAFPNSNLTMCPRCERITTATTTTTTDMSAGKLPARSNNLLPATTRQSSSAAC